MKITINGVDYPFVSIVIPVYNNLERLKRCIRCIDVLDYPKDKLEVIIVDNGSQNLSGIKLFISEFSYINLYEFLGFKSPYPCRNVGVKQAKGEIVALLDSNCFPVQKWLIEMISRMINNNLDIVGGKVIFEFSDKYKASEMVDSLLYADGEVAIKLGAILGGNAIIKKKIFDVAGYFRQDLRSEEDTLWGRNALAKGFKSGYAEKGIVFYKAKALFPFLKKSYSIGYGKYFSYKARKYSNKLIWERNFATLRPVSKNSILNMIGCRGELDMQYHLNKIWFVMWLGNIIGFFGRSWALIKHEIIK